MKICIASAIANGKGLQRDYELLRAELESAGHVVIGYEIRARGSIGPPPPADLVIMLEVVREEALACATRRWVVPNPEWWFGDELLSRFERVLCKTHDAVSIFSPLVGHRAIYTGWVADDRRQDGIAKERIFLHVAGGSRQKGTEAAIAAWKLRPSWPNLHVVANWLDPGPLPKNVIHHTRLEEPELRRLQNRAAFHVQPSEYEGFGHVVWEALSAGGVVVVPDAPPLDEIRSAAAKVAIVGQRPQRAAVMSFTSPDTIVAAVEQVLALPEAEVARLSASARSEFEEAKRRFSSMIQYLPGVPGFRRVTGVPGG